MNARFLAFFSLSLMVLLFLTACKERQVKRCYYYWANGKFPGPVEEILLKTHHIQKIYAKLMDIDWDEMNHAYPVSLNPMIELVWRLTARDSLPLRVVPVVFITNKTFEKIDSSEIPLLAIRVLRNCFERYDSTDHEYRDYAPTNFHFVPEEIQFDCDWTTGTASKYFYFLSIVKSKLPNHHTIISSTIRLHQFKYPGKTGIPPVTRGMLMVYNISDLTKYSPVNSIFDYDKARAYFTNIKKYPLPLDIALPAYSWGIIFRNQKFYMIENGLTEESLGNGSFVKSTQAGFYAVTQDTVFHNVFLRPGDEIKIEKIGESDLLQAASLARKALNNDSLNISLFDLSAAIKNNYRYETIEQVYNNFK